MKMGLLHALLLAATLVNVASTSLTTTTAAPSSENRGLDLSGKMFTVSRNGGRVVFFPPNLWPTPTPWLSPNRYATQYYTPRPYRTRYYTPRPYRTRYYTPRPYRTQYYTPRPYYPRPYPTRSYYPRLYPTRSYYPRLYRTQYYTARPYRTQYYTPRPYYPRPYPTRSYYPRPFPTRSYYPRPYRTRPYYPRPYPTRSYYPRPYTTTPYTTRPYTTTPYPTTPYTTTPYTTRPYTTTPYPTTPYTSYPPWTTAPPTRGVTVCLRYVADSPYLQVFRLRSSITPLTLSANSDGYRLDSRYESTYLRPNLRFWSSVGREIWTRVCVTVDSVSNVAQVFRDENFSIRKRMNSRFVWTGEPVLEVSGFDGQVTDVQVWDYPLSYRQIRDYMMSGVYTSYGGSALTWSSIGFQKSGNSLLEDVYEQQAKQPMSSRGHGGKTMRMKKMMMKMRVFLGGEEKEEAKRQQL
ncbi:uncharacterized protein V6R79_018249 [Siganus canaliculatus]